MFDCTHHLSQLPSHTIQRKRHRQDFLVEKEKRRKRLKKGKPDKKTTWARKQAKKRVGSAPGANGMMRGGARGWWQNGITHICNVYGDGDGKK
jgi:hypothetical protein